MTTKIKWRLSTLPTPEELRGLVNDKLLTKEEAREILFSEIDEQARDAKSLESEIKFLRELVERLSKDRTKIVETIHLLKPYNTYPWYQPYYYWTMQNGGAVYTTATAGSTLTYQSSLTSAGNSATTTSGLASSNSISAGGSGGGAIYTAGGGGAGGTSATSFKDIKTF